MILFASLLALALMPPRTAAAAPSAVVVVCDDVQDPSSLNPYRIFSEKTLTLLQQMLEGLLRFDSQGKLEPALAESWERINDITMRFHLRRGVRFHNGEPFDARAVKFSLEKYAAPQTQYPGVAFVGAISSVTVIDDHTVDVVTRQPDGLLLNRLAAWAHVVAPLYYQTVGDEGFASSPVGTGPFRFQSWEKGRRIIMSANPDYWMKGYPKASGLVFRFIPMDRQVDELLAGKIDILTNLPGTRTLAVQMSSGTFVVKHPTFYTVAGNFNLSRKPLSNKRVREALNIGIDRNALVRYDILGNGVPIGTLTFPGEFGHNAALKPYLYDPRRARRILAEEGYAKGFTLKVLLKVNAVRAGQILAKQLEALGVKMKATLVADAELFVLLKDRNQWDIAIYDCPDPMLHAYFIRSIFLAGDSPFSLSPIAGIDERLERMIATLDPEEQRRVSEEMDAYIHDEFLALPTYQRIRTYGLRRGVDFVPYVSGMPYFYSTEIYDPKTN